MQSLSQPALEGLPRLSGMLRLFALNGSFGGYDSSCSSVGGEMEGRFSSRYAFLPRRRVLCSGGSLRFSYGASLLSLDLLASSRRFLWLSAGAKDRAGLAKARARLALAGLPASLDEAGLALGMMGHEAFFGCRILFLSDDSSGFAAAVLQGVMDEMRFPAEDAGTDDSGPCASRGGLRRGLPARRGACAKLARSRGLGGGIGPSWDEEDAALQAELLQLDSDRQAFERACEALASCPWPGFLPVEP